MKILYVTTIGSTMVFFRAFVRELLDQGHTVEIACSLPDKVRDCYREWDCKIHPISCSRSPLNKGNLTARENGYVGGYMTKKLVEMAEQQMSGK